MVQSMISVGHWKVQDKHIQTYWYHHFLDVDCGIYIYILSLLLLSRIPTGVRVSNQFLKIGRTMCGSSPWMNTSVSHRLMLRGPRGMEAISRSVCGDAKSVGKPLVLQRMIQMKYYLINGSNRWELAFDHQNFCSCSGDNGSQILDIQDIHTKPSAGPMH